MDLQIERVREKPRRPSSFPVPDGPANSAATPRRGQLPRPPPCEAAESPPRRKTWAACPDVALRCGAASLRVDGGRTIASQSNAGSTMVTTGNKPSMPRSGPPRARGRAFRFGLGPRPRRSLHTTRAARRRSRYGPSRRGGTAPATRPKSRADASPTGAAAERRTPQAVLLRREGRRPAAVDEVGCPAPATSGGVRSVNNHVDRARDRRNDAIGACGTPLAAVDDQHGSIERRVAAPSRAARR